MGEIDLAMATVLGRQRDSFERTRPLCADHRDKQAGKECLACTIERQAKALGFIHTLSLVHRYDSGDRAGTEEEKR